MIIVSGSLPKSASTWLFNTTNALLVAAGHLDAQALRDRFSLGDVLMSKFNEISYASPSKLLRLMPVAARGHAVLVKTHLPPSRSLRALVRLGLARVTYIYRDPRDVALSALDHGRRAREGGFGHTLGKLDSVEAAIRYTRDLLAAQWAGWEACPGALRLRYEEVTTDPRAALRRVAEHLGLGLDDDVIARIAERFDRNALSNEQRELLLIGKAKPGRFRDEMTPAQLRFASECFAPYLQTMGYAA